MLENVQGIGIQLCLEWDDSENFNQSDISKTLEVSDLSNNTSFKKKILDTVL